MDNRAAIQGQLVSIKNVSTHKSVCLTIHVPEEHALKVIEAFGWPTMVAPISIAIARIDLSKKPEPSKVIKEPRKWNELSLCQRAAILCNEGSFKVFMMERNKIDSSTDEEIVQFLKEYCNVSSRKELDNNPASGQRFKDLDSQYRAWLTL
jgi:hypothetical protein